MHLLTFYETFERAYFLQRLNRFVMLLEKKDGSIIKTYVPNTGRMEEFSFQGHLALPPTWENVLVKHQRHDHDWYHWYSGKESLKQVHQLAVVDSARLVRRKNQVIYGGLGSLYS